MPIDETGFNPKILEAAKRNGVYETVCSLSSNPRVSWLEVEALVERIVGDVIDEVEAIHGNAHSLPLTLREDYGIDA